MRSSEIIAILKDKRFINEDWYNAVYPEANNSKFDAASHYVKIGVRSDKSPHPLFDQAYYLEKYPDVKDARVNPALHYLSHGGREWRAPSPLFDMDQYSAYYGGDVVKNSSSSIIEDFNQSKNRSMALQFFDDKYYVEQAGEQAGENFNCRLEHFLTFGLVSGWHPNPLIDISGLVGMSPAQAYREFASLFTTSAEPTRIKIHPFFDRAFYEKQVGETECHPLIDYFRKWKFRDIWPNPIIDIEYRDLQDGIVRSVVDMDPLTRYVKAYNEDNAWPNAYFDPEFYTDHFADKLKATGLSPIEHYLEWGHMHWFQPSEKFGQCYYLTRYPHVAKSGETALGHFLHSGLAAGYTPLPATPFFDQLDGLNPDGMVAEIKRIHASRTHEPPIVSVIIPAYRNVEYTLRCVWSALNSSDTTPCEFVIADDKSPDNSGCFLADALSGLENIRFLQNPENLGFLKTCNAAAETCDAKYLFFLNNDTVVLDGWLDELVQTIETDEDAGLVGSKLLYPNGLLQEAGGIVWDEGYGANFGRMDDPNYPEYNFKRDVDYISGAAIIILNEDWRELGGFSEEFAPAYYEDTDLAMKVRAKGKRVIYQPRSVVVHFEGISSGTDIASGVKKYQVVNRRKFSEKWKNQLSLMGKVGDMRREIVDRGAVGRILIFDAEVPQPDKDSGSITAYFMMKALCELGYRVTFVPQNLQKSNKYGQALEKLGVEVISSPYFTDPVEYVMEHGKSVDMFILSRAPTGGKVARQIKKVFPETPIVFDTVDIHHLRMMREFELNRDCDLLNDTQQMKALELDTITLADVTLLVSEYEVDYLRGEIGHFPYLVLPLIYEPYKRLNGFEERKDIAFVGGYRHPPNVDAVKYLVHEVWPSIREKEIGAKLHIIGSHMPPEFEEFASEDVLIVGFVEDLESYFENIRVTIAPLRYGAGVKGKVGNSLRMGVPVIGTPIAYEGMGLLNGKHVVTASSVAEFVEAVEWLYFDSDAWERMSRAGQMFVNEKFGQETAKEKLRVLTRSIISGSGARKASQSTEAD